jgi:S-disulfanyl-L-cysteine oxidoreductase SoxD
MIRRKSPFFEVPYALTAYILAQNKLIDAQKVIDAQTLPKVEMPNRNGFIPRFPERMPPPRQ